MRVFCSFTHTATMYYNYHAVAKRLIREGRLVAFEKVVLGKQKTPTFLLIFDGHKPMPIKEERVPEYVEEIKNSPSSHLVGGGDAQQG